MRRICPRVRNDHDFTGAGQEVDPHCAQDLPLSFHDKGIAWTEDLIHCLDRTGAISHGANRLNSANFIDLFNPNHVQSGEHCRRDGSVGRWWGTHSNSRIFYQLSQYCGHDHGGNKGDVATGNIEPDPSNRIKAFANDAALSVLCLPVSR